MDSPAPHQGKGLLTVNATSAKGVVWIVVGGEVDLANRDQLRTSLAAIELGRARLVYLDLRLLTFCDSDGCRTLVRFEKRARAAGCVVRVHRARPIVRKVMGIVDDPSQG